MLFSELNKEQQSNHITLLDGMVNMYGDARSSKHFDMGDFQQYVDILESCSIAAHECNTSACLLGHGPIFRIKRFHKEGWLCYSRRAFGHHGGREGGSWEFLFDDRWVNDIQEAIARLKMYIDGFDPDNESWAYESRYAGGGV